MLDECSMNERQLVIGIVTVTVHPSVNFVLPTGTSDSDDDSVSRYTGNGMQDYFTAENSVLVPAFHYSAAAAAVVDLLTNNSRRIAIGSAAAAFVRNNFDSTGRLAHTARLLR